MENGALHDGRDNLRPNGRCEQAPASAPVDLWCTLLENVPAELLQEYQGLLSGVEREAQLRLRFARDRRRFLVTRALVRSTLSKYIQIHPREWSFASGPQGKPIVCSEVGRHLSFNVTHTDSLIVIAVAPSRAVGVDAEVCGERIAYCDLAGQVLTMAEAAELRALADADRPRRFLEYWTLKESYAKALGVGLHLPLRKYHFDLRSSSDVLLWSWNGGPSTLHTRWAFWSLSVEGRFVLSVCAARNQESGVQISIRHTVPLRGEQWLHWSLLRSSTGA